MNATNWTDEQWTAYESAEVWVPVTVLETLIIAANAHHLGVKVSSDQKRIWRDKARDALALIDKKIEVI